MHTLIAGILICVSTITTIYSMEEETIVSMYNRKDVQQYFNNYEPSINEVKVLRYDPKVKFLPDLNKNICHQRLSLFVHGFGGSGNDAAFLQEHNRSDFVTFHLPDHEISNNIQSITKTSFGGKTEIIPLIYALNKIKETGVDAVDLVPISRSATTTITTLASLIEPSEELDKSLQRLFITAHDREKILKMIKKGTITIWWPLRDIKTALEEKVDLIFDSSISSSFNSSSYLPTSVVSAFSAAGSLFFNWIPKFSKAAITTSLMYSSLPLITSHKPWQETVPKSLAFMKEKGLDEFKIMTLIQPNDLAVHNINEGAYISSLPAKQEHKYIAVGVAGGHVQPDWNLTLAANAFRKKYGSSYDASIFTDKMEKTLSATSVTHIIEKYGTVQNFLDEYYTLNTYSAREEFWFKILNA